MTYDEEEVRDKVIHGEIVRKTIVMEAPRYLVTKRQTIQLTKNMDGFWQDSRGVIYAYYETVNSADPVDRCGVAPMALPTWPIFVEINKACSHHDFLYQSQVYQAFNFRHDADDYLQSLIEQSDKGALAWMTARLFRWISRRFGSRFWENPDTR